MKQHQYGAGDRVLWQCAFSAPMLGTVQELDGHSAEGEPEYRVEIEQYEWVLPLGESVLRAWDEPQPELAPLIGLVGRKHSGKDTAAGQLVEHYEFEQLAFGDRLKDLALASDPIISYRVSEYSQVRLSTIVKTIGWHEAKAIGEVRRYLQAIGDGVRDVIGLESWVRPVLEDAQALRAIGGPVVISDVRRANEAEAVRQAGGTLIKIVRPTLANVDGHASETEVDAIEADFLITNEGSLEDFVGEVHYVADALNLHDFTPAALAV